MSNAPIELGELARLDRAMDEIIEGHRKWMALRVYYERILPFCVRHGLTFRVTRTRDVFRRDGEILSNSEIEETMEGGSEIRDFLSVYFQDMPILSEETLPFISDALQPHAPVDSRDAPF